ncbi:MAG: stalk domain-containing protein, partial [Caldiserica bacterium]|nr:stalk domain-containing protein [Caldisericota bacterium]
MKRTNQSIAVLLGVLLLLSVVISALPVVPDASAASYEFSPVNGPYGGSIRSIAVSPSFAEDGRVAVGTSNGLYMSRDRGVTFSVVRNGLQSRSQSITGAAYSPDFARDRLALVSTEDGLYRSDDGGARFDYSNKGLGGDAYVNAVVPSPTLTEDSTVFASTYLSGAWVSRNAGRSWVVCAAELKNQNVVGMAVSPSFRADHTILFGVETAADVAGAWISTDSGVSAHALSILSENTGNALAFSPAFAADHTFAVGVGADGVFVTTDAGATFTRSYRGTVTSLLFSPLYPTTRELFIGTSGKGLQIMNTDRGSLSAATMTSPSPQSFAITALAASPAFTTDGTLFAGTSRIGLLVSKDGGKTLADSSIGITNSRVNAVAVSPAFATDRTVFFGTAYQGVARTFDAGQTLSYCNDGLTDLSIIQVALSPSYGTDGTVAAGTDGGGLFISRDKGAIWNATGGFAGYAVPWVAFAPDYHTSGAAFIAVEGEGLWHTTDSFATVIQCSPLIAGPDLADTVVDCVAASPAFATDHTLFVGTHSGRVYQSTDGGASFGYLAGSGLPGYAMKDLRISPTFATDSTIYMCTDYGTGSTREAGVYRSTNRGTSWKQVASYIWYDAIRISDAYESDGTVLAVSWSGGLDVTTNRGLVFGSMSSGIPLVSGKYWGNALDISPFFSTDGIVYVGLTNGGVFTTYRLAKAAATTVSLVIGSTTMTVNGVARPPLDAAPMIMGGRTLVPIRAIVEAIGGTVTFDGKDGKGRVDIALGTHALSLWIGKPGARLDGTTVQIDAANANVTPIIQASRTYLP